MPVTLDAITEAMFEALEALVPDPLPPVGKAFPPGSDLAGLARATPYVRRIAAVVKRLAATDVLAADDAVPLAGCAADWRHTDRAVDHVGPMTGWLLLIAGHQRMLDLSHVTTGGEVPIITRGAEYRLPHEHPLAAWGEAVVPALLGDEDGGVLDLANPGPLAESLQHVVPLLYEVLVRAQSLVEGRVVDALYRATQRVDVSSGYRGVFTRRRIAEQVAVVRVLLVELGLATWIPQRGRNVGKLEVTPLGCFGYLIFKAAVDGVWPELEKVFREHGYIPCDGGYINSAELPVDISLN